MARSSRSCALKRVTCRFVTFYYYDTNVRSHYDFVAARPDGTGGLSILGQPAPVA
ncbi:MAG: hypothetical protein P9X24_19370 [Candidatus Hatepunaea meridiana]|nr:hypothetical protein [Candidatus Hatepunaea meridiana]